MKDIITETLIDKGYGVRRYKNAIFAYIRTRDVSEEEIIEALGGLADLMPIIKQAADPHRWNRRGVKVLW